VEGPAVRLRLSKYFLLYLLRHNRIVIPAGAKRSGGTCGSFPGIKLDGSGKHQATLPVAPDRMEAASSGEHLNLRAATIVSTTKIARSAI
jgi:hypothetical protein